MTGVRFPGSVLPLVLITPLLLALAVFVYAPMAATLHDALVPGALAPGALADRLEALAQSPRFADSLLFTAALVSSVALVALIAGLLLALTANAAPRLGTVVATLCLVVAASGPAGAGLVIAAAANPGGAAAGWLGTGGGLTGSPEWAAALIAGLVAWSLIAIDVLVLRAVLAAVPRTLSEAAAIDCPSARRRFAGVTWPLIAPAVFVLFIVNLAAVLVASMAVVDMMAQASGGAAPVTVSWLALDVTLGNDRDGAALLSVLVLAALLVLAIIAIPALRRLRAG